MSIRRSYWLKAGDVVEGPFKSVDEAKEAASEMTADLVSLRTLVELETFTNGKWRTVH